MPTKLNIICLIVYVICGKFLCVVCHVDSATTFTDKPRFLTRYVEHLRGSRFGGCRPTNDFPKNFEVRRVFMKNLPNNHPRIPIWEVFPRNSAQLVLVTNWANLNHFKIVADNTLAPMIISKYVKLSNDTSCLKALLVNTQEFLTKMKKSGDNLVTAETGVKLQDLLDFLHERGSTLPITSIDGQNSLLLGDALSIGAHGKGITLAKEQLSPFGSLSSLVISFKIIGWDNKTDAYTVKSFDRRDPRSLAFMTNLGRTFMTEVTLLIQPAFNLRCRVFSQFTSENLFASPTSPFSLTQESFSYLAENFGNVLVTYFPYIDRSWVKVCSREAKKPLGSMKITSEYISRETSYASSSISRFISSITSAFPSLTPMLSRFLFDAGVLRMRLSGADDIYGVSHHAFYTTVDESSLIPSSSREYVILTSRANLQRVVSEFQDRFSFIRDQFRVKGLYPLNRPVTFSVVGVDSPEGFTSATALNLIPPALSVLSPLKTHSEFDTALSVKMEFFVNDPAKDDFCDELELWMYAKFQGDLACVRPTWQTEWSHERQPHLREEFSIFVKHSYGSQWKTAMKILDYYDPHNVFDNPFLWQFSEN